MKYRIIFISLMFTMIFCACSPTLQPQPTDTENSTTFQNLPTKQSPQEGIEPTGTLLPADVTSTPVVSEDDWAAVQKNGVLKIGTAADYPPFSYYNEANQLDGFDVALAREVAKRLGVTADINNFAFEGLISSLQSKQVDIVFAALSLTPSRLEIVDFSDIYYMGVDGLLAQADSAITSITSIDDFIGKRIAVQRSTVYQDWVETKLVQTGRVPPESLLVYDKVEDALRDLKENRCDIVMLDLIPAENAVNQGGVKLVGKGLFNQSMAAALRKDSTLTAKVNHTLQEILADGTMDILTNQYMGITNVSLPTQQPSTLTASECYNAMAFVANLSYDDADMSNPPIINPGVSFAKGWRIRNVGTCRWQYSYYMKYAYGNVPEAQMEGQPTSLPGQVDPGQEVDIYVNLVAPQASGTYQGFWNIFSSRNIPFGETVWVGITVNSSVPLPPVGAPFISSFYFNPTTIMTNQCAIVYWEVTGSINSTDLLQGNNIVWENTPSIGSYKVCPTTSGMVVYNLKVTGPGGDNSASAYLKVIDSKPVSPYILEFLASPSEFSLPACTDLQWNVSDAIHIELFQDDRQIRSNLPATGDYQFCANKAGEYVFRLVAHGQGGTEEFAIVSVVVHRD